MNRFCRRFSAVLVILMALFILGSCAAKKSPVVMTVDNEEISAREYAYFLRLNSSDIDPAEGDDGVKDAKEMAANQVILMHVILHKASSLGVTLSKEDQEKLRDYKKENIESAGGTAAYEKALKESGLTDTLFDKISESSFLYQKLSDVLYSSGGAEEPSDEEIKAFFTENFATVTHILKKTVDEDGNSLAEDVVSKKRAEAETLLEKVRGGADFLALVTSENEDSGLTEDNGYQYTFTYSALDPQNAMAASFEEASFALDIGGVSGVVETQYGYHIIKRLPLDGSYFEKNRSNLVSIMSESLYSELVQTWVDGAQITYTDEYDRITLDNLLSYLN